LNNQQD
jgi:hypothetical protein